jgi:hypothetical protein
MSVPTYHQLLAEVYEENASNLLIPDYHREEDDEEAQPEDKHPDELENKEDFNKFVPRHEPSHMAPPPPKYKDMTTTSVTYTKQIRTRVINVDSRFRYSPGETSTNFIFRLPQPVKNVISLKLSSCEFPNSFYAFSYDRGNTSFLMTYPSGSTVAADTQIIIINDGNWDSTNYPSTTALVTEVYRAINTTFTNARGVGIGGLSVTVSSVTGKVTISANQAFDINFRAGAFSSRLKDFGLGYNLGFVGSTTLQKNTSAETSYTRNQTTLADGTTIFEATTLIPNTEARFIQAHSIVATASPGLYTNVTKITSESILNVIDINYVYLRLNPDWKVVVHVSPEHEQVFTFGKIILDQPKFQPCYRVDNITKEYYLQTPCDIVSFPVIVSDPYDQPIDLMGVDFSFSLEVKEVLDASLYEAMRS